MDLRDENSKLLISSSPPLPFPLPFAVSMCFPLSSVEIKNNSKCSMKLCEKKTFRQVVKSDIILTPGGHLPRGSTQASHGHFCQWHTQMTLKWSPCSGPMNIITLELTTMNCNCLVNIQASWEQNLAFSVFSGSTRCLGCRWHLVLLSHNHRTHSMSTSVFHILVNSVTISPTLQMLSVLSTNTIFCSQHRKHGARHWEYRGELDR